jgi:hypothetical protein
MRILPKDWRLITGFALATALYLATTTIALHLYDRPVNITCTPHPELQINK